MPGSDVRDATLGGDTMPGSDATPDLSVSDAGPNDTMAEPCFAPTDCSAGLTCCVVFASNTGTISCQPSCAGDGVMTFVVCATDADCPTAQPVCTQFATDGSGRPINVCSRNPLPPPP